MPVALLPSLVLLLTCAPPAQEPAAAEVETVAGDFGLGLRPVGLRFDQPLWVVSAPDDAEVLFVVEKPGRVRAVVRGELQREPVLDLRERISDRSERGLLCLVFHPNWGRDGEDSIFLHWNDRSGHTHVTRNHLPRPEPGRPWRATDEEELLLFVEQPFPNHDGGQLAFGPDGYLYVGLGDGGAANDPLAAGQDLTTHLAKILRIDVDGGSPYAVPADNPFVDVEGARPEVWAYGLRNPWRFSFDSETGDLWIGDVGQNLWEEVDFLPADHGGGANFGWRRWEGSHAFDPDLELGPTPHVPPIFEYPHGAPHHDCSVTGGFVYRGDAIPELRGWYLWADYCSGRVGALKQEGGELVASLDLTRDLAPNTKLPALCSFGRDADGELYLVSLQGPVWKIVPEEAD